MALLGRLLSFPLLFFVLLCIGTRLAGSAPVPSSSLSTFEQRNEDLAFFLERFLDEQLAERNVQIDDLYERYMDSSDDLSKRDDSKENTLVRRKSIFNKIKDGFKKVGKGLKHAAKKVGEVAKKVVKVGAKLISTVQSVAAKAAKFIPGIGKPISAALQGASKVTGLVADKVPAKLGKKLEKGFKVMDKIQNPVGGTGGKVLSALRRDIDEETDFFGRGVDFDEIDARYVFDEEELLERGGYWDDEADTLL